MGYQEVSDLLKEIANVSMGISAYETPAKPMKKRLAKLKDRDAKPINWNKMIKRQQERRGEQC